MTPSLQINVVPTTLSSENPKLGAFLRLGIKLYKLVHKKEKRSGSWYFNREVFEYDAMGGVFWTNYSKYVPN